MTAEIIPLPYQPYTITDGTVNCYICMSKVTDPSVGHADASGVIIHPQHFTCAQNSLKAGFDQCGVCRHPLVTESLGYSRIRVLNAKNQRNQLIENDIVFERYGVEYDDMESAPAFSIESRFIDDKELVQQVAAGFFAWLVFCMGSKTPVDHLVSTSVVLGGINGWRKKEIESLMTAGIIYAFTTSFTALFPTQDWLTNVTLSATAFSLSVAFSNKWGTGARAAAVAIAVFVNIADMYLQHSNAISDLTGVAILSCMAGSVVMRVLTKL
jgi:hypothetical protein